MQLKKTKPEPRVCPVCSDKVGISLQSLTVHIRTKSTATSTQSTSPCCAAATARNDACTKHDVRF